MSDPGTALAEAPAAAPAAGPSEAGALQPRVSKPARKPRRIVRQMVPDSILKDEELNEAIKVLNENYEFEIHKTVWRIKKSGAKKVALQFPEGLQMYALAISDILERFAGVEQCVVLGDVTYGACCVDDYSARALECDLLIHYGHSCLVPVDATGIPCMYIFVNMKVDLQHLIECVKMSFPREHRLILAGTIQFNKELHAAKRSLADHFAAVAVPQCKPLSSGEVLGCTAPCMSGEGDAIVFVADGRFHLEALMIANPDIPAFRYDPYGRVLTREEYDQEDMRSVRRSAVEAAGGARSFGLVLGTLGRQGNPHILKRLQDLLDRRELPHFTVLMSELNPAKLALFTDVQCWIQIACPRLSIDWGEGFQAPILTPYEAMIALGAAKPWWQEEGGDYRMDYYSKSAGPWGNKYDPSNHAGVQI